MNHNLLVAEKIDRNVTLAIGASKKNQAPHIIMALNLTVIDFEPKIF